MRSKGGVGLLQLAKGGGVIPVQTDHSERSHLKITKEDKTSEEEEEEEEEGEEEEEKQEQEQREGHQARRSEDKKKNQDKGVVQISISEKLDLKNKEQLPLHLPVR